MKKTKCQWHSKVETTSSFQTLGTVVFFILILHMIPTVIPYYWREGVHSSFFIKGSSLPPCSEFGHTPKHISN